MLEKDKQTNNSSKINTEKLVLKAKLQLDDELFKRREYEVHFVIPYDEDGGELRGVIKNFTAESAADAVRYVAEKYGFPEIDDDAINKFEYPETDRYGIVKVRKVLNDKEFSAEDLFRSWEYIFEHYIRTVDITGTRIKNNDNREEVLMALIELFKLPRINKLTDKYKLPKMRNEKYKRKNNRNTKGKYIRR